MLDSANAKDRERDLLVNATDFPGADWLVVRLGWCGEKRTKTDVVRAFLYGRDGLRQAMGGFADPAVAPDDGTRRRD